MKEIIKKLKGIKGIGFLAIGLIFGLVLVALGSFSFGKDKNEDSEAAEAQKKESGDNLDESKRKLEAELKSIIESMDGVGNASVVVSFDESSCAVYAQDGTYSGGVLQSKSYVLSEGKTPIMIKTVYPRVRGVAVVCGGGSNPIIAEKITDLLCALLELNSTRVFVCG